MTAANVFGPLHQERHTDAAHFQPLLAFFQWPAIAGHHAAIVASKNNQRILHQAARFQRFEDASNLCIQSSTIFTYTSRPSAVLGFAPALKVIEGASSGSCNGVCGIDHGKYKKNGWSSFASIKSNARSVQMLVKYYPSKLVTRSPPVSNSMGRP